MTDEIEMPNEALERHEHAAHGHGGEHEEDQESDKARKAHAGRVTLLILVLAMAAAVAGKISAETEIRYLTAEIELSDTWAQYQGKSDRQAIATGFAKLAEAMPGSADPKMQAMIAEFNASAMRMDHDDKGEGKQQLADKAKGLQETRDRLAQRMEGFSIAVVLLAISIGLGSASMLSRSRKSSLTLASVACVAGVGAAIYGLLVGLGVV